MKGPIHIQSNSREEETIFRTKRIEMRLIQKEIAQKVGLPVPQYSRIESGDRKLNSASFMTACKILRVFDMSIEEYFDKDLENDCLLQPNAFKYAFRHLKDKNVVAVGGRLLTISADENAIFHPQGLEYKNTFNLTRTVFDQMHANCIISGAFGMFRKEALQAIGGYNADTVGEYMELVLRL